MKDSTTTTTTLHTESLLQEFPNKQPRPKTQRGPEFSEGQLCAYLEVLSVLCEEKKELWERMTFTLPSARTLVSKQIRYLHGKIVNLEKKLAIAEKFKRQLQLFEE